MDKKPSVLIFVEEERAKGTNDQEITHQLLETGWHMDIIQNALNHTQQVNSFFDRHPVGESDYKSKLRSLLLTPLFWGGVLVILILLALFI